MKKYEYELKQKFYRWIAECCILMDMPVEHGAELMQDHSWFFAYDDRLTPSEAVAEYLNRDK